MRSKYRNILLDFLRFRPPIISLYKRVSLRQKRRANDIEPIAKECTYIPKDHDITIIEMLKKGFMYFDKFLNSK
jgi:hypothetical protein